MLRLLATVLVVQLLCHQTCTSLSEIRVNEEGYFIDDQDRVKLFHGFNSVRKSAPYYTVHATNETQLRMFRDWGVNVVRLGVIWTGAVPQKGVVDETYLSEVEKIIDKFAEYGIYVFLDMHQDGLSTRFGSYDAIPLWLVDSLPKLPKFFQYPFPFLSEPKDWFLTYVTWATEHCAQNLYSNASDSWNHWGQFWKALAMRYRNKPNVLGYELINEPPPGDFYTNPARLLPGYAGEHNLLPLYDNLVEQIREVDDKKLIFYEPVTFGVFFPPIYKSLGTGFKRVPGSLKDPKAAEKSVLSYHYYCWVLQTADARRNMSYFDKILCDEQLLPAVFKNSEVSIKRTGGARFLTEFGLCGPDGNEESINTVECTTVLNQADEHFQSWTYWDGNFLDYNGNPIMTQVKAFSRTYPRTTNGRPFRFDFDYKTGNFYYAFDAKPESSDTKVMAEIFVPMNVHYTKGVVIIVEPDSVSYQREGNLVTLHYPAQGLSETTRVTVTITSR